MKDRADQLVEGLSSGGHKFYTFKNPEQIPQIRLEAYLARNHEFENLRIRWQDLSEFCEKVEQLGNEAEFMKIQQLNGYLKTLVNKPVNHCPLNYLASPLIVLDDEPLDEIPYEYDKKKLDLSLSDQKVSTFFLSTILNLKPTLKDSFDSGDRLDYTHPKMKMIEMIFYEQIS